MPQVGETQGPDLSVIVVAPERSETLQRTLECLRTQTVRDRIELILVGPTPSTTREVGTLRIDGFFAVKTAAAWPIENVEQATVRGVHAATAPVLALLEDHAFPEPRWAEALLRAHRGPWSVVGAVARNANPDSLLSWTNFLLSYGPWSEPVEWGEADTVSGHNVTIKRAALVEFGSDLEPLLGREGGLLRELRAKGHRFYLEPEARYSHANPSRLSSTAELRFNAGRLYAAERAARGRWSSLRRALYVAGSPLIPLVRLARIRRDLFAAGRHQSLVPRVFPALLLGLVLDAAGQMVGYLAGAGHSQESLSTFEVDRGRHLTRRDRLQIASPVHGDTEPR